MWGPLGDIQLTLTQFYDLRKEITQGVGIYPKEEILVAQGLVENKIGKGVIEERNVEFLFLDSQDPSKLMLIYVLFDEDDKKYNEKYSSKIFFIQNGKIVRVKPA